MEVEKLSDRNGSFIVNGVRLYSLLKPVLKEKSLSEFYVSLGDIPLNRTGNSESDLQFCLTIDNAISYVEKLPQTVLRDEVLNALIVRKQADIDFTQNNCSMLRDYVKNLESKIKRLESTLAFVSSDKKTKQEALDYKTITEILSGGKDSIITIDKFYEMLRFNGVLKNKTLIYQTLTYIGWITTKDKIGHIPTVLALDNNYLRIDPAHQYAKNNRYMLPYLTPIGALILFEKYGFAVPEYAKQKATELSRCAVNE